jgi:uncharacterized membrane protein YdfJ with MMPL/SSD domain
MEDAGVNWIAVLVAGVASFAFGSIYYMALAKSWMAAVGKTQAEIKNGQNAMTFAVAFIAQLVMAYTMARVMAWQGGMDIGTGIAIAITLWVGLIVAAMAVNHGFQGARRALTVIDSGHWLGVLVIQGVVIALFGL